MALLPSYGHPTSPLRDAKSLQCSSCRPSNGALDQQKEMMKCGRKNKAENHYASGVGTITNIHITK
eukprot:6178266-Amphidinium_carterae.1